MSGELNVALTEEIGEAEKGSAKRLSSTPGATAKHALLSPARVASELPPLVMFQLILGHARSSNRESQTYALAINLVQLTISSFVGIFFHAF